MGGGKTQALWKTNDAKAAKKGPHHTVFWVQRNRKHLEAQRLGNKTAEEMFKVGDRYVGDWQENKKHGFGVLTRAGSGEKYEGYWENDMQCGTGTRWERRKKKRQEREQAEAASAGRKRQKQQERESQARGTFNGKCHFCKKTGHRQWECEEKKKQQAGKGNGSSVSGSQG